ncbi:hypothetical protein Ctob_007067 [Chrysochromulina tobinii]|jgi:hypothetical protein|uniref:Uncharacterized protein n=1 Tax=Chrysochromulina tobinii TaxID=1460289 RepID=A0A0M0JDN4_9EUKA|nr:hypothetical protein Ctob_007067 [Chrysochromulina tobinii]|eukprot:KOO24580.1 hypothetical protein Ctob_007067 [Chrysochromulina sp. CCMP291]
MKPAWAQAGRKEPPICNRTLAELSVQRDFESHQQRLRDIAGGTRRAPLGNKWHEGPHRSTPVYRHVQQNLKRQQVQSERYDTIEHENRLLLDKMSQLMAPGSSVLDPTAGTWEFSPGVRLNRFQIPVIDHSISTQPTFPQRGSAREPESLNLGLRRRELERITSENRGIVLRIQGRGSQFDRNEWPRRSAELDRQLLLLRRPATSLDLPSPPVVPVGDPRAEATKRPPRRRARSQRAARTAAPPATTLMLATAAGDAKLLIGLCPGVTRGATLIIQPGEPTEETIVVDDVWLRRDGLSVALQRACEHPHPAGVYVHLYPEAEVHFNRARTHLDGASHLYGEEVTVRVP